MEIEITSNMARVILNELLLMASAYLFLLPLECMKDKKLKNIVILLLGALALIIVRMLLPVFSTIMIVQCLIRTFILFACICFCYQRISLESVYCSIWPIILFFSISMLWNSIESFFQIREYGIGMELLIELVFFALFGCIFEWTIIRWMPRNGEYHAGPRRTISALFVLILSQYLYYAYCVNGRSTVLAIMVQGYCVTLLYLQAELFKKSEINQELEMMERLWYQQKKQYEIAKDQMQVIDRKCHDMKYQVAAMRTIENPKEREKTIDELEQSIKIYDSIVKTGNEILDTLLSERSLTCEARNITMHCVIDGQKMQFMDAVDIYALFGNAIDNAIECVEKFSDIEMRFIDISVAEKQQFLYIRVSNPIKEKPEYEGDLPKTSKKNKQYHGIGLKSIRHIAAKYGGDITATTEMNCFILEILIPVKE